MNNDDVSAAVLSLSNALLLCVALVATVFIIQFIFREINGWPDFKRRSRRMLTSSFYGGAFDLAVAIAMVLVGSVIRHQTAWEFRAFDTSLRLWQLAVGTFITAAGILMMIRVTAPKGRGNRHMVGAVLASAAFMVLTYVLSIGWTPIWHLPL